MIAPKTIFMTATNTFAKRMIHNTFLTDLTIVLLSGLNKTHETFFCPVGDVHCRLARPAEVPGLLSQCYCKAYLVA
jgi:hypothetical protein